MDRRDFLGAAAAVAGLAVSQNILSAAYSSHQREGESGLIPSPQTPANQQPASGEVPYRSLGKTGEKVSGMLDTAAQHNFKFDAVQMPLNVKDAHFRSFEHQVLPRLVSDGIGVLGMNRSATALSCRARRQGASSACTMQ